MRTTIQASKTVFSMQQGIKGLDVELGPGKWGEKWVIVATLPGGRKTVHLVFDTETEADQAMDNIQAEWKAERRQASRGNRC